jgi:hypothetical protein
VDEDMAKALGHALSAHLPKDYPFICLDSVKVEIILPQSLDHSVEYQQMLDCSCL